MTPDQGPKATVQIALRISPELRERIKRAADDNNRSVNSELTAALEQKYPAPLEGAVPMDKLLEMSDYIYESEDIKEQMRRIKEVNEELIEKGNPIVFTAADLMSNGLLSLTLAAYPAKQP